MITETYQALAACARRRLAGEWDCTAAERDLLTLITELSFDLDQTWAAVPSLADFAAVLGIHKSTVCRALRRARQKGFLLVMLRRDETLYSLCTETRGTGATTPGEAMEVKARLVAMNRVRAGGTSDVDGQQRLPGVLPSEETEAPAKAFSAMMEMPEPIPNVSRGTISPPATRPPADDEDTETDAEFRARLERMVLTMEKKRGESPMPAVPADAPRSRRDLSPLEEQTFDEQMTRLCRGLSDEQRHAMNLLRDEFASAGKLEEAAYFKWGSLWKSRVMKNPLQCLRVAGEHKAMRLMNGRGADQPGAWMYRAMQSLMEGAGKN